MKLEIISIGDELLVGQTINTNAAWMGGELSRIGASVDRCVVIRDEESEIVNAIDNAFNRVDVVLVTGGLGPTKDDITKKVLCKYFDTKLVEDKSVLANIKQLFESRNREMQEVHYLQALVPETAIALNNIHGTAPGMLFKKEGKLLVSMPGVPYEMKYIMSSHVLPYLDKHFNLDALYYKTLYTVGIGESWLASEIEDIENSLRSEGVALAYLPSPGQVRLRLSGKRTQEIEEKIHAYASKISQRIPKYCFSDKDEDLAYVIGNILRSKKKTLGTIESCTGGALASSIVKNSGSSDYFLGSIVSYSNEVKADVVGVDREVIVREGAVSQEVVEQMALKGLEKLKVDYTIAISGIAGPDGGTIEKPVGTIWIAIANGNQVISRRFQFEQDRNRNIKRSMLAGLNMLRCELLEINY